DVCNGLKPQLPPEIQAAGAPSSSGEQTYLTDHHAPSTAPDHSTGSGLNAWDKAVGKLRSRQIELAESAATALQRGLADFDRTWRDLQGRSRVRQRPANQAAHARNSAPHQRLTESPLKNEKKTGRTKFDELWEELGQSPVPEPGSTFV